MIDLTKFDGHTAGPWQCLPFSGKLMARITMGGTSFPLKRELMLADAALLSAAPDLLAEVIRLRAALSAAPVAIMDTREALGLCAPTEEDFPALYALQGRHVALVEIDVALNGGAK